MGFSLIYAHLHEEGIGEPEEAVSALENVERRGWLRRLRWDDGSYRPATYDDVRALLTAYPELKPGWNADIDFGNPNLHFEVTDEGKAEWRRRHPLERRHAWRAEGVPGSGTQTVWAIDEEIADSVAGPSPDTRAVEPAIFELRTGETIEGVKVTYGWLNRHSTT